MSETDTKEDVKVIEQTAAENTDEKGEQQAEKKQVRLVSRGCPGPVLSRSTFGDARCCIV